MPISFQPALQTAAWGQMRSDITVLVFITSRTEGGASARERGWVVSAAVAGFAGVANAIFTMIGTATDRGPNYNLIYEDDNNGRGLAYTEAGTLTKPSAERRNR